MTYEYAVLFIGIAAYAIGCWTIAESTKTLKRAIEAREQAERMYDEIIRIGDEMDATEAS